MVTRNIILQNKILLLRLGYYCTCSILCEIAVYSSCSNIEQSNEVNEIYMGGVAWIPDQYECRACHAQIYKPPNENTDKTAN